MTDPAAPPSHAPLRGIRVIDFSRYLPGPLCALHLAWLGADVVSVERAPEGDPMRALGPFDADGVGIGYRSLQRAWSSVTLLDLQTDDGRTAALQLCADADVVLESFRPGVAARLGIGASDVHAIAPSAIYCSISGYGQSGAWRDVPGHDANYLAATGILAEMPADDSGAPHLPFAPLADIAGAQSAATAICAALVRRATTGEGAVLDIALAEAAAASLGVLSAPEYAAIGDAARRGLLRGSWACYRTYACANDTAVALSAIEPHFFATVCDTLNLGDVTAQQFEHDAQTALAGRIADRLREKTAREWVDAFADAPACIAEVRSHAEALVGEPFASRDAVADLGSGVRVFASPYVIDGVRSGQS